jgi:predicted DNA-binding protein (UPF0251 family)
MTPTQFDRILAASRIKPDGESAAAARLVLIDGLSAQDAASRVGLNRRTVDRCVARIVARHQPRDVCPTCGHATGR